jgi:prevent-host-death family protein
MIKVNVHQAKTNFSKYLEKVAKGQTITVCKRNVPIAELRPISAKGDPKRLLGYDKGRLVIPPEFFEPLPDDLLDIDAFSGLK